MTQTKTKKALLMSVLSMVLCVAMLVGMTFAWFTDTASTAVNKIQAGNLKVALEMANGKNADGTINWVSAEGKTLNFAKAAGHENEEILWEPGCTYKLPELRVVNKGNLALKYKIQITGISGDDKLAEVIEWKYQKSSGAETAVPLDMVICEDVSLGAETEGTPFTISGHMLETANNDYQGLSIRGIAITVVATQDTVENDSFRNTYDAEATYPDITTVIKENYTADGLKMPAGVVIEPDTNYSTAQGQGHYIVTLKDEEAFVYFTQIFDRQAACDARTNALTDGTVKKLPGESVHNDLNMWYGPNVKNITVKMGCDVDLNNMEAKPFGMSVNFDGNGHTIKNAKLTDVSGFFAYHTAVSNVTLDNIHVTATGLDYAGVVEGYCNTDITNVTVKNSSVTGGKYTGAIVGDCYGNVTNCTVENTTVSGQYKVGGIAGYVCNETEGRDQSITDNKLTDVTVKGENLVSGKTEFVIGKIVGNWNHVNSGKAICKDNNFSGTTTATENIGLKLGDVTEN